MNENNEHQDTDSKELKFPMYFLARKPEFHSTEIIELTAGPYMSVEQAEDEGRTLYGWNITKYAIVETEQKFKVSKIQISN